MSLDPIYPSSLYERWYRLPLEGPPPKAQPVKQPIESSWRKDPHTGLYVRSHPQGMMYAEQMDSRTDAGLGSSYLVYPNDDRLYFLKGEDENPLTSEIHVSYTALDDSWKAARNQEVLIVATRFPDPYVRVRDKTSKEIVRFHLDRLHGEIRHAPANDLRPEVEWVRRNFHRWERGSVYGEKKAHVAKVFSEKLNMKSGPFGSRCIMLADGSRHYTIANPVNRDQDVVVDLKNGKLDAHMYLGGNTLSKVAQMGRVLFLKLNNGTELRFDLDSLRVAQ